MGAGRARRSRRARSRLDGGRRVVSECSGCAGARGQLRRGPAGPFTLALSVPSPAHPPLVRTAALFYHRRVMEKPRIFISAVTREFGSARQRVADAVRRHGYAPVWHDTFGRESGDLRDILRRAIATCDG